jgi:hypothetical protein
MVYQLSCTAFFTAMVLNLTSLVSLISVQCIETLPYKSNPKVFEDSVEKRQLALLATAIKACACHNDMLMVLGLSPLSFDSYGVVFIPLRYAQVGGRK